MTTRRFVLIDDERDSAGESPPSSPDESQSPKEPTASGPFFLHPQSGLPPPLMPRVKSIKEVAMKKLVDGGTSFYYNPMIGAEGKCCSRIFFFILLSMEAYSYWRVGLFFITTKFLYPYQNGPPTF